MNISIPQMQSPDRNPQRLRLSQPKTYSTGDSSCGNGLSRLRRTCGLAKNYPADQPVPEPEPVSDSSDTVDVPNAQPGKYNPEAMPDMDIDNDEHEMIMTPSENVTEPILPPKTSSSNEEAEDMYVDYHIKQVQGGGDNLQCSASILKPSTEGAYSLVANSLRLSTV